MAANDHSIGGFAFTVDSSTPALHWRDECPTPETALGVARTKLSSLRLLHEREISLADPSPVFTGAVSDATLSILDAVDDMLAIVHKHLETRARINKPEPATA